MRFVTEFEKGTLQGCATPWRAFSFLKQTNVEVATLQPVPEALPVQLRQCLPKTNALIAMIRNKTVAAGF